MGEVIPTEAGDAGVIIIGFTEAVVDPPIITDGATDLDDPPNALL